MRQKLCGMKMDKSPRPLSSAEATSQDSIGIDKKKNGTQFLKRLKNLPGKVLDNMRNQDDKSTDKSLEESLHTCDDSLGVAEDSEVDLYESVPLIEQIKLPRGGISMETKAVGRVQFGIPPETIKDSMRLGIPVPQVYIVPADRFCREIGPALGVNLAEFEFPAYFNFFIYKKRCTLVVDSQDAEDNIRRVFSETLLGPDQFRRSENPIKFEEEDFAPDFPREAIPDFQKELQHFRIMPDGKELVVETLLNFCKFQDPEIENTSNSQKNIKSIGHVATVWPEGATEEQKESLSIPRVEIYKMSGGTEYILHDIDANDNIIGKARFAGIVKVSKRMSVDGFGGRSFLEDVNPGEASKEQRTRKNSNEDGNIETLDIDDEIFDDDDDDDDDDDKSVSSADFMKKLLRDGPPSFHPPSFGVTVLGNSHGFDKNGSTSGYVLWINGRGVMIDPPPYSSATLEREGIRPGTIVGIVLTHCHADHDAGAFQKVLTGSPVVVITTPTIYKSFIRKYAALSSLSPALLKHSHRYKPAIIGQPLRFQGAIFHFTYSLHVIPCVGFRVEWRGRSMVFTGDHLNKPSAIDKLQEDGVLSPGRADDLRKMPLQETDLLLHEAGTPPVHTPLEVLMQLPKKVKNRLYVVHTSSLPDDCDLRVAPTGTAGTIRLDQGNKANGRVSTWPGSIKEYGTIDENSPMLDDELALSTSPTTSDYDMMATTAAQRNKSDGERRSSMLQDRASEIPPVLMRPASSTDAWFILKLLSAVPFLSSLSYASTMEVLETARVDAYCMNDVIVPAEKRSQILCVVWEGTCVERNKDTSEPLLPVTGRRTSDSSFGVWHAGDWTAPISLQPEKRLSGNSNSSSTHDIVALSSEGVKVIKVEFSGLHHILKNGSALYRKYLERIAAQKQKNGIYEGMTFNTPATQKLKTDALRCLSVLDLLDQNSILSKLSAAQKRHLESLAEGPVQLAPGEKLWRAGEPVERAFLMVSGSASFIADKKRSQPSNKLPKVSEDASLSNQGEMFNNLSIEDNNQVSSASSEGVKDRRALLFKKRSSRVWFMNKVLGGLIGRPEMSGAHVFRRGHFLGDVSKMVQTLLSSRNDKEGVVAVHSSTLAAGKEGCVVIVFPKHRLVDFLDEYPGVLLSLFGRKVFL